VDVGDDRQRRVLDDVVEGCELVLVEVIDCTMTGAPPPIATPPTWI